MRGGGEVIDRERLREFMNFVYYSYKVNAFGMCLCFVEEISILMSS